MYVVGELGFHQSAILPLFLPSLSSLPLFQLLSPLLPSLLLSINYYLLSTQVTLDAVSGKENSLPLLQSTEGGGQQASN